MSGNWVDGTHNGAFRKYEIYVTMSGSPNPADWGSPVAVGEWYWPNRQETREVSFEPTVGQYVYFRRITAWGWYSAQDPNYAQYGYPGFANANEIWITELRQEAAAAVDSDGDGLTDYVEDANGDGTVSGQESDPSLVDTDGDGLSDGVEVLAFATNPALVDTDGDGIPDAAPNPDQIFGGGWPRGSETPHQSTQTPNSTTRIYYVPLGTDAIHFNVSLDTGCSLADRKNDSVTYRISGTALGESFAGMATFGNLGEECQKVLVTNHCVDVHDRMAARDGFIRLDLLGMGTSPKPLTVTVGVGGYQLELESLSFSQWDGVQGNHVMSKDDGTGWYLDQWSDNDPFDEILPPAPPVIGPACFSSGTKMRATVKWRRRGGIPVTLQGLGTDGYNFPATIGLETVGYANGVPINPRVELTALDCSKVFPSSTVDFIDPLSIQWRFQPQGYSGWIDAGVSENPVYVTLRTPTTPNLYRTVVHLACSTPGATNDSMAIARTWIKFAGPGNVTTWDGFPLKYYGTADPPAKSTSAGLLRYRDGTCDTFANLLQDALQANGVPDITLAYVRPPGGHAGFAVVNIGFDASPDFPNNVPYVYSYFDVLVAPSGIAGQNTATPAEKRYGYHRIVRRGSGTEYYDPSYGITASQATDYTPKVGAWMQDVAPGGWRAATGSGLNPSFAQ